ncbi:GIY-YIG nuclease family protein [Marinomonas sp. C2222]|uniref:GIY-YIG nuclease family protein n=1 Tax=Marinomonas sargassi TaxID=2984494 RepID=A0ABT2YRW7_9GAMM|nr:GIY-YIG nuclease family protein [Marinomonas sargassi]MCV2402610.1 GIY-YIG nuclease family protein [Marinomonas sargassi]
MIVFKITNNITGKHYIGTSFNSGFQRFEQYVEATEVGLDFPLYNDIKEHGTAAFTVEELYETSDKKELYELESDYLSIYNGESLRGYKIAQTAEKSVNLNFGKKALFDANGVSTAEQPKKARKTTAKKTIALPEKKSTAKPDIKSLFAELISEERLKEPTEKIPEKKAVAKRPQSKASIQKMLKEAEKTAKKEREQKLKSQQQAEAEEMALVMAKIDLTSKAANSAFRRKKS